MRTAAARRAVLRWAWRLFRAEWRQQVLVLALLSVAVAAATFGAAFAYNAASDNTGIYGSADRRIKFDGSQPSATATDIAAAQRYFGGVDLITTRTVPVPGSAERLEVRAQNPQGPYSAAMLTPREGRYPTGADEVALTDEVARTFEVGVGGSFELQGRQWRVVGLVENPGDLDDEFALVPPEYAAPPDTVTMLVGERGDLDTFRQTMAFQGNVLRDSRHSEKTVAAVGTLVLATVGMLLVAVIAATGFVVMAQRRVRELGMLAAIGATERQVRLPWP